MHNIAVAIITMPHVQEECDDKTRIENEFDVLEAYARQLEADAFKMTKEAFAHAKHAIDSLRQSLLRQFNRLCARNE